MKEIDFRNDVLPLKNKLFRLALRITLQREEAEDIVQDTLLKVWNSREEAEIANIEAFAMTICRNLALDVCEKKERCNIRFDEMAHDRPDISPTPDESMISGESRHLLENIINTLPEKQRTAIQLREIEGKNYKEIALIMGVTETDVKVSIFRARKKIKEQITGINQYGL